MPRRNQTAAATIKRISQRLAREFEPERIILFGSHARGEAGPDSDIDLLVIMPLKNARRDKAGVEVAMRLAVHDIKHPKDIIVMTPQEVEQQQRLPGNIARPALQEGKTLYARRA
jgi:predicted nucleotidyltransferase